MNPYYFVADFETYYDVEYSLSKLSALAYIYDERFEVQGLSVYCPALGINTIISVALDKLPAFLEQLKAVAHTLTLVGQNSIGFDALIFAKYGVFFKHHIDTQVLSRYRWGSTVTKHSLEAISERLNLTVPLSYQQAVQKLLNLTDEDMQQSRKLSQALGAVKGKRLVEIEPPLLRALHVYCEADVWLTREAASIMLEDFPKAALHSMDYNAHALINIPLRLDVQLLDTMKDDYTSERTARLNAFWSALSTPVQTLMREAIATKKEPNPPSELIVMRYIRSKDKLVELLAMLGVASHELPMKEGKGGQILACAKTDLEWVEFGERYNDGSSIIPELVALRSDYATTATESKLKSFAQAGHATPDHRWAMHIQTFGAVNTGRHSGGNATANSPQNLKRAKPLFQSSCGPIRFDEDVGVRDAIMSPEGRKLLVYDSSGIELRMVGYLTQERAITDALADPSRDLYVEFARRVFNNPALTKKDKKERFVGKVSCLSLQYLTGPTKLAHTAALWGQPISTELATVTHRVYREANPSVVAFWETAERWMRYWSDKHVSDSKPPAGDLGCVKASDGSYRLQGCPAITLMSDGLKLPNGFRIRYPKLSYSYKHPRGWTYYNAARRSVQRIHAGLVLENCIAKGTEVLTETRGWVAIETVQLSDRVWNGTQWCTHQGLIHKGEQPTITRYGVEATPDHLVWDITEQWVAFEQATPATVRLPTNNPEVF